MEIDETESDIILKNTPVYVDKKAQRRDENLAGTVNNTLDNKSNVYDKSVLSVYQEELNDFSYIDMKDFDNIKKVIDDNHYKFDYRNSIRYNLIGIDYNDFYEYMIDNFPFELRRYSSRYFFTYKDVFGLITTNNHGYQKVFLDIDLFGSYKDVNKVWDELYDIIEPRILNEESVNLHWLFKNKHGDVDSYNFNHTYKDIILSEAYPYIENFDNYLQKFITGEETLLIFQGIPGTGKTRLIRHLLREMSAFYKTDKNHNCYFGFTNNPELINNEQFYMQFLLDEKYVGMILEDSDVNIKARKGLGDNTTINKLLFASDGFIPHNKKIILSTNLDVENIDSAIIRSGRCYDFVKSRKLTPSEANTFVEAYNKKFNTEIELNLFKEDTALCDIYRKIKV